MNWTRLFPSVRKAERERFQFFFLLFTFLVLGQTVGLVGAESLLLANLGASVLPGVFIVASVVTVLFSLLYAFGVDRARNDNYFIQILMVFAALIAIMTYLAIYHPSLRNLSLCALFCLYYANFAISTNHFWTFAADFFDSLQTKRLFPIFTVGASFGGLVGGGISSLIAGQPGGAYELLWGWVASCLLAAFWLRSHRGALRRWGPLEIEEADESSMDGMRSSIRFLRSSRLGKLLVLSALFMVTSLFVSQYIYSDIFATAYPEPDELAKFFGLFLAAANGCELVLEVAVTPWLLSRFGIANANLFHPLLTLVSFAGLGLVPGVPAAIFARLNRETLENAVGAPVRNLLFNALPARLRGRMRAFLEGMVVYSGMAFAGLFLFFWDRTQIMNESGHTLLALGGFFVGLGFFATNFALKSDYLEQLLSAIRDGRIEPEESSSTLETLPSGRLLDLWYNVLQTNEQSPLLDKLAHSLGERGIWGPLREGLNSQSALVRLIALRALAHTAPETAHSSLHRALQDKEPKIRLYAVQTLPAGDELLRRKAHQDGNPEIRAQAAARCKPVEEDVFLNLLQATDLTERLAGLQYLPESLTDNAHQFLESEEHKEVVAALQALRRYGKVPSTRTLEQLFQSSDTLVRQEVIECASNARVETSPNILNLLRSALFDSNRAVRRAVISVFVGLGEAGKPILVETIRTSDSEACHCAISALAGIGDEECKRLFSEESLARAKRAWSHKLEAAKLLEGKPDKLSDRFLVMALQDSAERELNTCFRLMEALEEERIVRSVENVLRFAHARIRSDALEVLSNLGNREATTLLVHLLEDGDLLERAGALSGKVPSPRPPEKLLPALLKSDDKWLQLAARASDQGTGDLPAEQLELMERLLLLQSVPLFATMTLEQLEAIHSCLTEQVYTKGEVIFNEGDIGDEMYIVADGQVEILLNMGSPNTIHLATVEKGSYFGEMSVLDRDPRSAAARVSEDARLFVLKGEQLKELIYVMPEIAFTIFRVLSERLRRSDRRLLEEKPAESEAVEK